MQKDFQSKQKELESLFGKHKDLENNPFDVKEIVKRINDDTYFYSRINSNKDTADSASQQNLDTIRKRHDLDHQLTKLKAELSTKGEFYDNHYMQKTHAYQRQVGKLGSVYDNLKRDLKQNKVIQGKKDWAYKYCQIFDKWMEDGATHSINKLKEQIVQPIEQLIEKFPDNQFTPVLRKDVDIANALYEELKTLPNSILDKLKELSNTYGAAADLADNMHKGDPITDTTPETEIQELPEASKQAIVDTSTESASKPEPEVNQADTKMSIFQKVKKALLPIWPFIRKHGLKVGIALLILPLYWLTGQWWPQKAKDIVKDLPVTEKIEQLLSFRQHHAQLSTYTIDKHHDNLSDTFNLRTPNTSAQTMRPYYGIDVSHLQNKINWDEVVKDARHIDFAIVKATEGASWRDPLFRQNWKAAKEHFKVVGAYHFFNKRDPKQQAANFISQVQKEEVENVFFPVIDVEQDSFLQALAEKGQLVDRVKQFIQEVKAHYGTEVIIYSGHYFYDKYLKGQFQNQFFWLARYCECNDVQDLIHESIINKDQEERIVAWQFSDKGRVKGIDKVVDLNYVPAYFWEQVAGKKKKEEPIKNEIDN